MKKLVFVTALAIISSACSTNNDNGADWVLTGGRIYTVDDSQPWVEAVAIRDRRIVYAGDDAGAGAFISSSTKTNDLDGRMVIPGIIDGHTHPGLIGIEQYNPEIDAPDRETFIAQLEAYAANNPGDGWIRACCWPVIAYVDGDKGPDRADLDAIFPDRPVWVTSSSWHSYWLNSRALEELGVDDDTPDPRFPVAMYKRDGNGRLTGWVKEGAGWQHFIRVFEVDNQLHRKSVTAFLQTLSENGVTTVYDGGNLDFSDEVYGLLAELDKAGKLPLRYEGTYMISIPERRKLAVTEMKRMRDAYAGERLRFNTIKLFMDGIDENRSGAMIDPYSDDPDYESNTTLTVGELRDLLLDLHEEKFDLHIHVIGDLAVRNVLDAVEAAKKTVGDDFYPRVTMAHLQNIHASDIERFAGLGVSANFTAWWNGVDVPDPAAAGLGEDRSNDTYRAAALTDAGANVTFSSDDWRLDVLSPFLGMEVGHTRQYPREWLTENEDPENFRLPASEKLPLELMVKGYTLNGAYPFRMEADIGSIEVGKYADFVVLRDDLFSLNAHEIHKQKPLAVIMEGDLIQGSLE